MRSVMTVPATRRIVAPIEERVQALIEGIEATEAHLRGLGFDPATLAGSTGFARIKGLKDAVEAVYSSDEAKRRFEILARHVFVRFKALLTERRDTADVTELLKELHRIVNEAIRTQAPGDDRAEGLTFDLSQIDMEQLRDEFAKNVQHKATALQDIREIVEQKLDTMLKRNPSRMDYQQKHEEIVDDYNHEKDRVNIENTFRRLMELMDELDAEQKRAIAEGLNEDELALFDLLKKDDLAKAERERVKQASRNLLASIKARLAELDRFLGKGADQGGCRGVHSQRGIRQPADAAVHCRGEEDGRGRRLWSCLATGRQRCICEGGVMSRRSTAALYRRQPKNIRSGKPMPLDLFEVQEDEKRQRVRFTVSCRISSESVDTSCGRLTTVCSAPARSWNGMR